MVTFTSADDRRQSYKANQSRRAVNAARQHKATFGNADWLMSRPADWYTELDDQGEPSNWRAAKNVLKHIPAVTTDQNENRNMFQMLANQAKGGDKGARLIDTRGLPDQAYRTGRKIYQDPSKSQGFFGDMRTMAGDLIPGLSRSPNPAAIHVNEWNPFPKAGFAADWYKDQFPIASGLDSLMGLAEKSPTLQFLTSMFPKRNRVPLERDLSWVPEGLGEYDKLPMMEFEDEVEEFPFLPEEVLINIHPELDDPPPYHGRGELPEDFDYSGMREEIEFPYLLDKHMTRLEEALESIESGDTESEDTENVITEMYENPEVDETTFEDTFNERYVFTTDPERDPDTYPGVSDPWEYFLQMKGLLVGKSDAEIIDILLNSPDPVIKLR